MKECWSGQLTSCKPTRVSRKIAKENSPATAQGRKYGWSRNNAIRPNVFGHVSAGCTKRPPITGLHEKKIRTVVAGLPKGSHPKVTPVPHIKGIKANASPIFVESVSW